MMITVVPLTALMLVLAGAARDYYRARQFDDWWSKSQTVTGGFQARARGLLALPVSLHLRDQFSPEDHDAGIIRLEVPGPTWDSLEGDPQRMWGQWVEGVLRYGESTIPVRLRKRGDNSIHWLTDKRTLTIRTPRDDFYKRFRSFGLSAKDVLPSYLTNRLARDFDLLAPETTVVPVYLNNRFYGMYRFVEVVDESFLRPFDRMPGNIFQGDAAERGEYFKGVPRNLFQNPYIWDRASANDRWTSAGSGQLGLLLEDIAGSSFDDHLRLMQRIDRAEFARLFAYLFIMGDPYHMDGVHNELIYEDPSTQRLHPIPWDTRLLPLGRQHPLNDWFQAVLQDPFVVDQTVQELARWLANDAIVNLADSLVSGAERRYQPYFAYDRLRAGLVPDVGSADRAMATVRGNVTLLRHWLDSDDVAFAATTAPGATIVDFETRGLVGSDLMGFRVVGPWPKASRLRLDTDLNGTLDSSDSTVVMEPSLSDGGAELHLARPVSLYAGWDTGQPTVGVAGHVPYRMFLTGLPPDAAIEPILVNRVTGRPAHLVALEAGTPIREGTAWHPWRFPASTSRVHRLAGSVRLDHTLMIPAGDTLVIEPGTTLLLGPEVSIVSEGRLLARGTAQRPIRVVPAQPGEPWGTFSVLGHGADSSIVTWAEIAGGGGALINRVEYIGMVNLHRADGVVVEHVTFRDNVRSDDTFHALHSRFHLRNSHFIRANSDAVDLDISSGEIVDNTFEATGGDAIDLMTSTPWIQGNRIKGSGDKGISIGEASRPFVFNNAIDSCKIGIEVKDRSEPILLHNRITRSGIGLRERRKNWRYGGGGWAIVAQSVFEENGTPRVRDVYSRLTLAGVVGLDSAGTDSVLQPANVDWLYRMAGIRPEVEAGPGLLPRWDSAPRIEPVDTQSFNDDFGAVADGWTASGGIGRMEKRRDALVLEVERHPGAVTRAVDWDLPTGGTMVLELAGRDISGARAVVRGPSAEVSRPFDIGNDLATARFVTVDLPPGRYTRMAIELVPVPGLTRVDPRTGLTVLRGGRLDLRGYRVVPTPPKGTGVALDLRESR